MLHFYFIKNKQTKPYYPEFFDLKFAGKLSFKTFNNLQKIKIIPAKYHFFGDFRWDKSIIEQLLVAIKKRQLQTNTDVQKLFIILTKALKNKLELIVYAD